MNQPELLAPAGSPEKLQAAVDYGADAVYCGGATTSLRAPQTGFDAQALAAGVAYAHAHGTKVYYCLNAIARPGSMEAVHADLAMLEGLAAQPDGLIIADPGVFALARREVPHMDVHISTQANTANAVAARFWADAGATRVNLARELSAREIRAIRHTVPDMELEVFVHGAMCMAVSGRCFLSDWLTDRSGNAGVCAQPCRYEYRPIAFEEELRPGQTTWEVAEDEGYTKFFAAEDLCLVKYLAWFVKNRIDCIKLEGRMKSPLYVVQVTDVYRTALDDLARGHFRPGLYAAELAAAGSRVYSSGFFLGEASRRRTWDYSATHPHKPVVARVAEVLSPGRYRVQVRAQWQAGAAVEAMEPGLKRPPLPGYTLLDTGGTPVGVRNPGQEALLAVEGDSEFPVGRYLRLS